MKHSDYYVLRVTEKSVYIVDENRGNLSVTNDAENVCKEIYAKHGNKKIYYFDSEGHWDELIHENGIFKKFGFGIKD